MSDMSSFAMSAAAVVGTTLVGLEFDLPHIAVIFGAAMLGSASSAGWRWLDKDIRLAHFAMMSFISGMVAGVFLAWMLTGLMGVDAAMMAPFAYFFSQVGAKLTRSLASGPEGERLLQQLLDRFRGGKGGL